MYDLVIKNGRVLDPSSHFYEIADIAVQNGRIVGIEGEIAVEAAQTIDASGCIITPGLIDFHTHLYPLSEIGIPAEAVCFASGVTTAIDCGSAGAATYPAHRGAVLSSRLRILAFLHVSSAGLATGRYLENPDPKYYDRPKIAHCLNTFNELIGLKIRQGAEIVGSLGLSPLRETIVLAEELGVPVMVHCSNPPEPLDKIISLLRQGDILTHAYQDRGDSLLDNNGHISQIALAARERGVIFDVANANIHFSFKVARAALSENFLPDIISTDLTTRSLYKRPTVFNMLHVLSKYLNLGLTLEQVIERCTSRPAEFLGMRDEIGCLKPGACADIAVLRVINKRTEFGDCHGEILQGDRLLKAMLTVRAGEVVYRDIEF
ncbi:MAG: amidohydrolase family protein [Firmicutes bacterium]|nr:amidohydrolase family protein [Bacillota bacterium]